MRYGTCDYMKNKSFYNQLFNDAKKYWLGTGTDVDLDNAYEFAVKAVDESSDAVYLLFNILMTRMKPGDREKAVHIVELYKSDNNANMFLWGRILYIGLCRDKEEEYGKQLMQQIICIEPKFSIEYVDTLMRYGSKEDYFLAIDYCKSLAEKGNEYAIERMGRYYSDDRYLHRNYDVALDWYFKNEKKFSDEIVENLYFSKSPRLKVFLHNSCKTPFIELISMVIFTEENLTDKNVSILIEKCLELNSARKDDIVYILSLNNSYIWKLKVCKTFCNMANVDDAKEVLLRYPKNETLSIIHSVYLNALKFIDEVCAELRIHYFIGEGTLLGSIRHNGFVPWDDDIDIYMFREDIHRFNYFLSTHTTPYYVERFESYGFFFKLCSYEFNISIDIFDLFSDVTYDDGRRVVYSECIKSQYDPSIIKVKYYFNRFCHPSLLLVNLDEEDVFPSRYQQFEDMFCPIFNKSEEYLNKVYGPYYKMPLKSHVHLNLNQISEWSAKYNLYLKSDRKGVDGIFSVLNKYSKYKSNEDVLINWAKKIMDLTGDATLYLYYALSNSNFIISYLNNQYFDRRISFDLNKQNVRLLQIIASIYKITTFNALLPYIVEAKLLLFIGSADDCSKQWSKIVFPSSFSNTIVPTFRKGYSMIYDGVNLVTKCVNDESELKYQDIEIVSKGYYSGSNTIIKFINLSLELQSKKRGLNVTVMDPVTHIIIDFFNVDSYSDPSLKIRRFKNWNIRTFN